MPVISELIGAKLTPLFPNYYGPMTSITTSQWHYIAGGKAGEELFSCCSNTVEREDLANTAQGKRLCQQFKKELEFTGEKPQEASSGSSFPIAH